jgi:hypothetical protein
MQYQRRNRSHRHLHDRAAAFSPTMPLALELQSSLLNKIRQKANQKQKKFPPPIVH